MVSLVTGVRRGKGEGGPSASETYETEPLRQPRVGEGGKEKAGGLSDKEHRHDGVRNLVVCCSGGPERVREFAASGRESGRIPRRTLHVRDQRPGRGVAPSCDDERNVACVVMF